MKCPKCSSENVSFHTHTSGGGGSICDSCCGMILLGPIGILCGLLGSGVSTEEFWICQDCGNRFSNSAGQEYLKKNQEIQNEKDRFIKYNTELASAQEEVGDYETIRNKYQQAVDFVKQVKAEKDDLLQKLTKDDSDSEQRKYAKQCVADDYLFGIGGLMVFISLCLFALGFFMYVMRIGLYALFMKAIIILPLGLPLAILGYNSMSKAEKKLSEINSDFKKVCLKSEDAEKEKQTLKCLVNKIDFVEQYSKEHQDELHEVAEKDNE